jgi:hypothetical protein
MEEGLLLYLKGLEMITMISSKLGKEDEEALDKSLPRPAHTSVGSRM